MGGRTWISISAGVYQTCGVTSSNEAYCWGSYTLGTGNFHVNPEPAPVRVATNHNWRQVIAGASHICALTTGDEAWCWGSDEHGALGNGSTQTQLAPVAVTGGRRWKNLTIGGSHMCGVTTNDEAYCWGNNDAWQLGNANRVDHLTPTQVPGGHTWAVLSASRGIGYTCGVTTSAEAYCWGQSDGGQLGHGQNVSAISPTRVVGSHAWKSVAAGGYPGFSHTCGLTTAGAAYCWGIGALGDGSDMVIAYSPSAVAGGHTWTDIQSNVVFSCGVTTTQAIYCWGENEGGRLGTGDILRKLVPTRVLDPI
jgi:alpha-tubulin suppressor-like RCC1 family protein